MTNRAYHALILCTGNSARSILAEAILNRLGQNRIRAHSAGSRPTGRVHPLAIEVLIEWGHDVSSLHSKSWDEFAEVPVDAVITLCDEAANRPCPTWPGGPISAHWSLPDPGEHPGTGQDRGAFALRVAERLRTKIEGLIDLDWSAKPEELRRRLQFLGEI